MIHEKVHNPTPTVRIVLSKMILVKMIVIAIFGMQMERVHAQGCSVTLKITDPAPVCTPLTVDLTNAAITDGSTGGLIFSYYLNPELTIQVPSPSKVNSGTFYIKGVLSDPLGGFVAASVKVTVNEKPKLIIANPVAVSANGSADLTLPQIKIGSDEGLVFTYWLDSEAKNTLPSPNLTGKGEYFIKGTSANGCSDIRSITISN